MNFSIKKNFIFLKSTMFKELFIYRYKIRKKVQLNSLRNFFPSNTQNKSICTIFTSDIICGPCVDMQTISQSCQCQQSSRLNIIGNPIFPCFTSPETTTNFLIFPGIVVKSKSIMALVFSSNTRTLYNRYLLIVIQSHII